MGTSERIVIGEKFVLVDGKLEDLDGKEIKASEGPEPRAVHPDGTPIEDGVHIGGSSESDATDNKLDDIRGNVI